MMHNPFNPQPEAGLPRIVQRQQPGSGSTLPQQPGVMDGQPGRPLSSAPGSPADAFLGGLVGGRDPGVSSEFPGRDSAPLATPPGTAATVPPVQGSTFDPFTGQWGKQSVPQPGMPQPGMPGLPPPGLPTGGISPAAAQPLPPGIPAPPVPSVPGLPQMPGQPQMPPFRPRF